MGNWTFDVEDDFTLPDGDWITLDTQQLERIHEDFAMKCNYGYNYANYKYYKVPIYHRGSP